MKKLIFITFSILLFSCEETSTLQYEKPFIIISKSGYTSETESYIYQDKNGYKKKFFDVRGKYSIGDTLK